MRFFTICTRSYLPFAATLRASVHEHHPEATFTAWLIDPGDLPIELPGLERRAAREVFSAEEWKELTYYYAPLELATAVKPRLFERQLAEGASRVVYLDPDILLFRPLDEVGALLDDGAAGVLTPHITAPLPADDRLPDDLELLGSGVYNLGFLALAAHRDAWAMLEWWWSWLRTHCLVDKSSGTFTDQKWMNFSPLFWPSVAVLRDPTFNVAYWNLPQRELVLDDDGPWVDGRPLTFFHFSGFDPLRPARLSKYDTRIDTARFPDLARLLREYSSNVCARGYEQLRDLVATEAMFDDGIPFDAIAHRAYRDALRQGLTFDDPAACGPGSFHDWLCEPVRSDDRRETHVRLTRYLLTLYRARPDLHETHPDPFGDDLPDFVRWVRENAIEEMGAEPRLLALQFPEARIDVGVVGRIGEALGLIGAATPPCAARALLLQPLDPSSLGSRPVTDSAMSVQIGGGVRRAPCWINLLPIDARDPLPFRDPAAHRFFRASYNVGVWTTDSPRLPSGWFDRHDLLDEIWVPNAETATVLARELLIPVVTIPPLVQGQGAIDSDSVEAVAAAVCERLSRIHARLQRRRSPAPGLAGLSRRAVAAVVGGVGRVAMAMAPSRRQIAVREFVARVLRNLE